MPKIYEYLGITISFFSDEHEPIHVHAEYDQNVLKVSFFIKDGKIYRTTYADAVGKFPPAKMKVLKEFISLYKDNIIQEWTNFFILKKKVKFERITKRI